MNRNQSDDSKIDDYAQTLFQGSPVAGLGEEDEKALVGRLRLLRLGWIVHAY